MVTAEKEFAVGKGTVHLEVNHNNAFVTNELRNVLHTRSFEKSVISVSVLDEKGLLTEFQNGSWKVVAETSFLLAQKLLNQLYVVECFSASDSGSGVASK